MNFLITYVDLAQQIKAINDAVNAMNASFIAMNKSCAKIDTDEVREFVYDHVLDAVSMHDANIVCEFATLENSEQFARLREYLTQFTNEQLAQYTNEQQAMFVHNAILIAKQAN